MIINSTTKFIGWVHSTTYRTVKAHQRKKQKQQNTVDQSRNEPRNVCICACVCMFSCCDKKKGQG